MNTYVKMMIQFDGKQLTLPINPESIEQTSEGNNTDIQIVGLGRTVRKGEPGLTTFSIESFFPNENSYFYTGVKPKTCIEFIEKIRNTENKNNNVAKIVTTGLPVNINMYFVVENFKYSNKAGEEEDIYYTLDIKQYKAYGAKTVKVDLSGLASARAMAATQAAAAASSQTQQTYTVKKGDCLWNIAKACCGNGARWGELYNLNKNKIKNPNLIYPGQVLTLPAGWASPTNVTKLKSVQKTSTSTSNTKKTTPTQTVKTAGGITLYKPTGNIGSRYSVITRKWKT